MNKLKWFSKNAINNSEEFSYKDGFVYTDNLSEQLDSATVVLPFIEKKQFEPFDIIELYDDRFGYKTMLIDNVDEMQVEVGVNKYDYTLSLMSLTKSLERITLPNISVTRRATGIPKTLQQVIEELLEDYSPKILTENGYERLYTIPTYSELNIACPDLQMSKPTLREAIDRVLSVIYCISKVNENHEIELFDINQKNNPIVLETTPEINYRDETQSTIDYASELENQYNNVTPNKNLLLKNYTLITEYIGFRNESKAVIDSNSVELYTNKPIYLIKSVKLIGSIHHHPIIDPEYADYIYEEQDMTDYVYEEQEFNVLPFDKKRVSVYYSRGSKRITGWNNESGWWIFNETVKERMIDEFFGGGVIGHPGVDVKDWIHDIMFKIEYYAQDESIRGKSGKYLPETNENNAIIDNPSEAFVDIQRQGELFNQKVNRLGNRAKVMTGRFTDYSRIPVLGDYYGDYIVMNRELAFYDNFINVKLTLTQDFVNINYFTGINARRRSWQIVSAGEAFDKQLLDKWFCEFSFNIKSDYDNTSPGISAEYLLNVFTYTSKPILHSIVETPHTAKTYQQVMDERGLTEPAEPFSSTDNFNFLELDLSSYISGNSLLFNFQFFDNFSAALSLSKQDTGGTSQNYNRYVDENGENTSYTCILINELQTNPDTSLLIDHTYLVSNGVDQPAEAQWLVLQNYSALKPRLAIDNLNNLDKIYEKTIYNHKDNREKININVQFEFCSDTKDIVIGRKFLERQNAVSTLSSSNADISSGKPVATQYTQQIFEPGTETPAGWKGYGTLEVPELRYVENVRDITITGDSRNTVSYSNGVFTYEVYIDSTLFPLLPYIGVISYKYNYGSYKVYISPEKYKYGDQTLKANSILCDSYNIDTYADTQRTARLEIMADTHEGINGESIAIVDADNKLILAVNQHFENETRFEVTCYLNLLRTRDRKVYLDKTLKHFNS